MVDNEDDQILQNLIEFARGDSDTVIFEQWLYKSERLEEFLGSDLYLHLISSDYRHALTVSDVRDIVWDFCETKHSFSCRCHTLRNLSFIGMGEEGEIFNSLKRKENFSDDRWWLSLFRCSECSQPWLIACEQRIYDVYFMLRLHSDETNQILIKNIWPDRFKSYRDLLRQAVEVGCSVSYVDPLNSLEIYWTIVDVALANPEISIFELEELLPIDIDTVGAIAKKAVKEPGVFIRFGR